MEVDREASQLQTVDNDGCVGRESVPAKVRGPLKTSLAVNRHRVIASKYRRVCMRKLHFPQTHLRCAIGGGTGDRRRSEC